MITKITIFTRPSTAVEFPGNGSPELNVYTNATYRSSPVKLISKTQTISKDLLTLVVSTVFDSQASLDQFNNDPALAAFKADRDAYMQANGISMTESVA